MTPLTDLISTLLEGSPIIPVLSFVDVEEAVDICNALYAEDIKVLEITLRHPCALDAIAAVRDALPADAVIGAGTILSIEQAREAKDRGAAFGVSPGLTRTLANDIRHMDWPFLPGIATLSEAMTAREEGFQTLKFFPAEISGGIQFIKAIGSVLPDLSFCPTGGVSGATAANYLALKNVFAVGGSWLTERDASGKIDPAMVVTKARATRANL